MIVINISSGLGNQLFQYAAGRALSLFHNTMLVGDPISFAPRFRRVPSRVTRRSLLLKDLGLFMEFRPIPTHILTSLKGYSRARRFLLDGARQKYVCKGSYEESFVSLSNNVLLDGYFQDRRYFLGYQDQIISEIAAALEAFAQTNGVLPAEMPHGHAALHVRRGDYLHHPELFPDWFEHYSLSIAPYLIEKFDLTELHIFTDDECWCRNAFKRLGRKVKVMVPDVRFEGISDLIAMSRYPVLAIANSTFSWWAGATASRKGSQVIAPSKWSDWCPEPTATLFLPTWGSYEQRLGVVEFEK